jgi:hypothetical protein
MASQTKPDLHLEIGHVLFMDVVGFSKLLINNQSEILERQTEKSRTIQSLAGFVPFLSFMSCFEPKAINQRIEFSQDGPLPCHFCCLTSFNY